MKDFNEIPSDGLMIGFNYQNTREAIKMYVITLSYIHKQEITSEQAKEIDKKIDKFLHNLIIITII